MQVASRALHCNQQCSLETRRRAWKRVRRPPQSAASTSSATRLTASVCIARAAGSAFASRFSSPPCAAAQRLFHEVSLADVDFTMLARHRVLPHQAAAISMPALARRCPSAHAFVFQVQRCICTRPRPSRASAADWARRDARPPAHLCQCCARPPLAGRRVGRHAAAPRKRQRQRDLDVHQRVLVHQLHLAPDQRLRARSHRARFRGRRRRKGHHGAAFRERQRDLRVHQRVYCTAFALRLVGTGACPAWFYLGISYQPAQLR